MLGLWAALATFGAVWLATGGTFSSTEVIDGVVGLGALLALLAVVKLPWDLYFQARNVQRSQADSLRRSIEVSEEERGETRALAHKLLLVALTLHLVGAAGSGLAAWLSGGRVGLFAAGAFLVTMALRPTVAMVEQVRKRLGALQRRAVLPPIDATELAARLGRVESACKQLTAAIQHERSGNEALALRLDQQDERLERALRNQASRHQQELDRLGLETERALEKLTRDREVLAGLRAFLQMVRAS